MTLLMGIVNVTPDSFSDGGRWYDEDAAVARGLELAAQGADILDVGGESTRPGAQRPEADEEARRVLPVIRRLAAAGLTVSVDTMRAQIARAALDAGARYVNDVSAGQADPAMLPMVAERGADVVLMHWRAHSAVMNEHASYADVVGQVCAELLARVDAARAAGVADGRIILDPGLGFSKETAHNVALLAHLDRILELGFPVLVGASRKRFVGAIDPSPSGQPRPVAERDAATVATTVLATQAGVWGVRVHDVAANRAAIRLVEAVRAS